MKLALQTWSVAGAAMVAIFLSSAACNGESRKRDEGYNPSIRAENFTRSTSIPNPYLPFVPGVTYVYKGTSEEGRLRIEVKRLSVTRKVMGIDCVVVNDRVWLDGKLIEDTNDWYAQDNEGTVWYFGEEVDNYGPDGKVKDHEGAWEAGVDGALPGIAMPANPKVGRAYRQEYYFGEAEDEAEVVEVGLTLVTASGTYNEVVKTKETTALEPDALEYKFYAPGVGLVKASSEADKEEIELVTVNQ
jgi:hypothetical protein